ncbi:hypothetical protein K470DRAFT_269562 [Piedraia hortae CBS 480.64]|uniref:Uncharacterized protein n=1 Tax=Piedraia hortae CBS 480.64 TaxID=1314780 RepID=A0A6A7C3B0_9PEZI|nr:hypothetical protein K470DRAFT_269562 [Piedraia hortae CBS 480.64]
MLFGIKTICLGMALLYSTALGAPVHNDTSVTSLAPTSLTKMTVVVVPSPVTTGLTTVTVETYTKTSTAVAEVTKKAHHHKMSPEDKAARKQAKSRAEARKAKIEEIMKMEGAPKKPRFSLNLIAGVRRVQAYKAARRAWINQKLAELEETQ